MIGAWHLSYLRLRRRPWTTLVLVLSLALTLALPFGVRVLMAGYEQQLLQRAASTPLILGSRSNRFDVVLSALYFRQARLEPISLPERQRLQDQAEGVVVPLHLGFQAQGYPLVGTTPEYFERRHLRTRSGHWPLMAGEAILGATVAKRLKLETGNFLFSDVPELYDLTVPPALKLRVSGILQASKGPDDEAVFVDLSTSWILEGFAHGHQDPEEVDSKLVLGGDEDGVVMSRALLSYQEITPENLASFHDHGDPERLPLTALLFWPASSKEGTLLKTRINQGQALRMFDPQKVVEELLAYVLRIRRLVDYLSGILAAVTLTLGGLVFLLSSRLREAEFRTLQRLGCSRFFVTRLILDEIGMVVSAALLLALTSVAVAGLFLGDVAAWLR
ncbi:MAG: hypothetical protein DWQ01_19365 [Planctomycetota bacterium]|nr:MAG: hypothetical protein DWQ01_19365 [Planctomycetota bacterium]